MSDSPLISPAIQAGEQHPFLCSFSDEIKNILNGLGKRGLAISNRQVRLFCPEYIVSSVFKCEDVELKWDTRSYWGFSIALHNNENIILAFPMLVGDFMGFNAHQMGCALATLSQSYSSIKKRSYVALSFTTRILNKWKLSTTKQGQSRQESGHS